MYNLTDIRESFRRGSVLAPVISKSAGILTTSQLVGFLKTRFSSHELDVSSQCEKAYTAALNAARSGDTGTAARLVQTAWSLLDLPSLSDEVKLLCTVFICATSAYVHYRNNSFAEAHELLLTGIKCDAELERLGFEMLHAHRLHLIENIIKTEIRAKNVKRAFEISGQLLPYLSGACSMLDFPGAWGPSYIEKVPPIVMRTTFAQVAAHIADAFFVCSDEKMADLFDLITHGLNRQMKREYVDFRALLWLRAKRRYLSNDFQGFLSLCPSLLSDGPSNTQSVWFNVLLDLVLSLERMDEQSINLGREIAEWVAQCGFRPRGIAERFSQISAGAFRDSL